jgi:hypothetical protein
MEHRGSRESYAFANAALAAMTTAYDAYDKGYEDCRKLWKQELAAEREKHIVSEGLLIEANKELRDQLAAEQEQVKNWEAVALSNKRVAENCMAALAKAKEAK